MPDRQREGGTVMAGPDTFGLPPRRSPGSILRRQVRNVQDKPYTSYRQCADSLSPMCRCVFHNVQICCTQQTNTAKQCADRGFCGQCPVSCGHTLCHFDFHHNCLAISSMALALSAHTPWVQLVSHVACWLTGLGFRHT